MNSERKNLARRIAEEFDLGECVAQESIGHSGRGIITFTTNAGRFVAKPTKNEEKAALYSEVERTLNSKGIKQARLFSRPDGSFLSTDGFEVSEFVDGVSPKKLIPAQLNAALAYLAAYNSALASIMIPAVVKSLDDPWNQAADPAFLIGQVPCLIDELGARETVRATMVQSLDLLRERQAFSFGPVQLIHGDVGPDNFIVSGNQIVTLIDFITHPPSFTRCVSYFTGVSYGKATQQLRRLTYEPPLFCTAMNDQACPSRQTSCTHYWCWRVRIVSWAPFYP